ncbi:unnamed protein product [Callosobruchus maculatus]|uniref:Integrase catalytic domain-containing protein n=1 Tax=Callosobruchus maculatus TaxID=64391 RepID=A0A653C1L0_CALMS|nr:unnamed protein product [Callosobruchus maculatus]
MGVESVFGWVVHGVSQGQSSERAFSVGMNIANVLCTQVEHNADAMDLKNFWDLELIGINNSNATDQLKTDNFLKNNITYNNDRYKVSLPWKEPNTCLDSNYEGAFYRLTNLTRKLVKTDKLCEYDSAMREYLNNECAERSPDQCNENKTYFMPHRAVYRDDKDTSKIRIVFDASAHAPGLPSLNEVLEQGENLTPHLFHILLNFRFGAIAVIADIEKAFLQIEVEENDRDALSFLWYEGPINDSSHLPRIVNYRMKRVTFGVNCSPFLLAATLKKHLQSQSDNYNDTCSILLQSFYVDDLVVAVNNEEDAERIFYESKEILAKAGMNLRKWNTNNAKLRGTMNCSSTANTESKKVLGVLWHPSKDVLMINLDEVLEESQSRAPTKRTVLQTVSRIFDPLGFLSPFTIRTKILLQSIWKAKLHWDEPLPDALANEYARWFSEITSLSEFTIPRNVLKGNELHISLHIFADASPVAYGAAAYLRCEDEHGKTHCKLLIAKARVSPINESGDKQLTLPRLELTAAVCATRLQHFILSNTKITYNSHTLWTDSKITLHWINGKPSKWKPYVCHRVSEIQKSTIGSWRHCPGSDNPADLLTRGVKAKVLLTSEMWQCGPEWLRLGHEFWPNEEANDDILNDVESSVFAVQNVESPLNEPIFCLEKYSSLEKILRITAYVKRFIHNLRNKDKRFSHLKSAELEDAEKYWIMTTQQRYFSVELASLKNEKQVDSSSNILTLNPFLDDDGIIRLGGRLQEASLSYKTKYPVIIPKKSALTDKLIESAHLLTMHGGVNLTITQLRKTYWIIQCRQRVKTMLNRCMTCRKLRTKSGNEPFAPLPKERVTMAAPFKVTGTDFAGPLYVVSETNGRKKTYIMLFTCAVVRAVHLELVPDLTTESCINALRRFVSRRGVPDIVCSDNARTFKRTCLELKELTKILTNGKFQAFAASHRIEWRFIAERAAWWGGFWERMVKTVKDALKLTLGKSLTFEELQTVLSEVEATVNSRPLTYIENDADNLMILTPSHFLLGTNECGFFSDFTNSEIKKNQILEMWKKRNAMSRSFWKRWSNDYLQQLRSFHKSHPVKSNNFRVGDVALLHDQNVPRLLWKLVRITQVFQGRDGKVRACEVVTGDRTTLRRPIQLLFPLEVTAAREDVENCEREPATPRSSE